MKLNIFTLTWNKKESLTNLRDSLLPSLKNIDYHWFIKDNGSSDNTADEVKTWGNNITVFPYKDNSQNFSEGMNYLYNQSSPNDNDQILLLNNDVTFNDTKSIHSMRSLLKDNVGAVGARLLFTNTNRLQHAGVVFNDEGPFHYRRDEKSDKSAEYNREFQVVTGAVLLTKGKYFKNVSTNVSGNKGFDEKYHWAFDDVDFCLSIKYNQNKKIIYCGSTNISHEESASLKKNPVNIMFMKHNINLLRTKWRHKIVVDHKLYNSKYNTI